MGLFLYLKWRKLTEEREFTAAQAGCTHLEDVCDGGFCPEDQPRVGLDVSIF